MNIDLTAGLDESFEYFLRDRPENPQLRDSATLWIMDDSGTLAFPRVTFDAIGADWTTPNIQLNFAHADGRTLRLWTRGQGHVSIDDKGRAAGRGAGPLHLTCIEPFRRWSIEFNGQAMQSTSAAQLAGEPDGELADLAFSFEAEMAAPPWLMGGMTAAALRQMQHGQAASLMGGVRYEQLCRIRGVVTVGREEYQISGTGMRVRRQGVRNMGAAMGHCQHSALFPSGRAFGAIVMAPGPDGPEAFNEAFLFTEDGRRLAARVVHAPWMTRLRGHGDDATLVFESDAGTLQIEGEVLLSMFDHHWFEMADSSILHQGTARYMWDGEETVGLIERCTLRNRLEAMKS